MKVVQGARQLHQLEEKQFRPMIQIALQELCEILVCPFEEDVELLADSEGADMLHDVLVAQSTSAQYVKIRDLSLPITNKRNSFPSQNLLLVVNHQPKHQLIGEFDFGLTVPFLILSLAKQN